jgi:hypothetical protein
MIHYLIYVSKAAHLMSNEELRLILEQSRRWNTDHGITGMLIYVEGSFVVSTVRQISAGTGGRFMQVLEGTELEVNRIFNIIQSDPRHSDLIVLAESTETERNFESWTMGFESLSKEAYENMPDYLDLDEFFSKEQELPNSNSPLLFLQSFYQRSKSQKTFPPE